MARCELFYFKEENFFQGGALELDFLEQLTGVGLGGGERWLGGSGTSGEDKFSRSLMKGERKGQEIFGFSSFSGGLFFFFGVALSVANCFSDPGCFFCSETFKLWNTREYFVLTSTGGN